MEQLSQMTCPETYLGLKSQFLLLMWKKERSLIYLYLQPKIFFSSFSTYKYIQYTYIYTESIAN